ncbi:MAG: hypothetical protein U5N58_06525 [Actinomycetota bacterium]|nr:hypothetical protein [Actinomycetota bacterium]
MKKKHIIILVTLVLAAVVAIFAYLNMAGAKSNQALLQQQLISVTTEGRASG